MNSLNILSARIIGQPTPGITRLKARSRDHVPDSKQTTEHRRGRPVGAKNTADEKQVVDKADKTDGERGEATAQTKEDVESVSEKQPLLARNSKLDAASYKTTLQSLVKRIADALTALLTTIGAPVIYVVNRFKNRNRQQHRLFPFNIFPGGRKSTPSAATAIGLSNTKDSERMPSRNRTNPAQLRTSTSSESLASNTSDSEEVEKKRSRPRSSEIRQPKSKANERVTSRRSIRIQEFSPQVPEKRRQKVKSNIGNEPLTVDSLKSPMATSQSLKIHKYPQAPAPPRPLIPRRQPSYSNLIPRSPSNRTPRYQKTLVLDLDETLIHSLAKGGRMSSGHMVEVKLNAPVGLSSSPNSPMIGPQHPILYYVHKRPHCDDFLRRVCQWYKLVLFTASVQEYADPVIDWLEQERKFFQRRYYRQHCTLRNGAYIKDLSSIEPDLSRVIILDNSPMSYIFHEDNAIPIEGWINDPTDNDLLHLTPLLEALQYVTDVRALLALKRGEAEV